MNTPTSLLTERYQDRITGVLSCFDRVIISGSLVDCCHEGAMRAELVRRQLLFFDYGKFVNPLRNRLHDTARSIAQAEGVEVEFIQRPNSFRKEDRIAAILAKRGTHPGLVHVLSAMENCTCYKPWHDRKRNVTTLRAASGRCTHYYFYFIDADYGLCYLRVPTWAPFRLQFYFNGHQHLAARLRRAGIDFRLQDNAFVALGDVARAQELADELDGTDLQRCLEHWARRFCPVLDEFPSGWHWSIMQAEYATDIVFRSPADLKPLYETLTRTAIQEVKADNVATFLGRNGLAPASDAEGGSRYNVLVEGTRIRHSLGQTAIKMYDKFGHVLRLETVSSDVSFFKHYRKVVHRDGSSQMKFAPLKKTIHSLGALRELMAAANHRYLKFISGFPDPSSGSRELDKVTRTVRDAHHRPSRGLNFFRADDLQLVLAVLRGEHAISGVTVRRLRPLLPGWKTGRISRALRRLRSHGLIRRISHTFKYYLTSLGRRVFIAAQHLREATLIPALAKT